MEDKNRYLSFNEFLKDHPEIKPEWKEFVEPVIKKEEKDLMAFILSRILM